MVTLTGTFTRLDGGPATGTVKITPSRSPILDSAGRVVISGPQVFPLDKDGKLTTEIPASNDPDLGPAFTYSVDVNLTHASWKINKVWIPHGSATVDLSEIADYTPTPGVATRVVTIPADGEDGQVLVWTGAGFTWQDPPQGLPGEVTTAALTTALAGKVSGTGMTVRVDTSVGTRVMLDHPGGSTLLHGDTGWRALTEWDTEGNVTGHQLTTAWEPMSNRDGGIYIRRVNEVVYYSFRSLERVATSPALVWDSSVRIPISFRGDERITVLPGLRSLTEQAYMIVDSSGIMSRGTGDTVGPNGVYNYTATTVTSAPWPTTLPGTPL